jgi:hypothetical protein
MHLSFPQNLNARPFHFFFCNLIIFELIFDVFDFPLLKDIVIRTNPQISVVHLLHDQFPNNHQLNKVKDQENDGEQLNSRDQNQAQHIEGMHKINNNQSKEFCII